MIIARQTRNQRHQRTGNCLTRISPIDTNWFEKFGRSLEKRSEFCQNCTILGYSFAKRQKDSCASFLIASWKLCGSPFKETANLIPWKSEPLGSSV
jgi:hypothetical protein